VPVDGLHFGLGVEIPAGGPADGILQCTLLGTTALGDPQLISVEVQVTSASVDASGGLTASGPGRLDMGDGTTPVSGVPTTVTLLPDAQGLGTLTLIVGQTSLPPATLNLGRTTIEACITPSEVAADSLDLMDAQTITWLSSGQASSYDLYRGMINGSSWSFNQVCLQAELPGSQGTDSGEPLIGEAFYYLVLGRNGCGEGSLGMTSQGQNRPNPQPCP